MEDTPLYDMPQHTISEYEVVIHLYGTNDCDEALGKAILGCLVANKFELNDISCEAIKTDIPIESLKTGGN